MGVRFPVTFLKVCTGAIVCALASISVYITTFCIIICIGVPANDNASFPWVGNRMLPVTTGYWSRHPQPHCSGSTVGGSSPRRRVVSLFLPPHPHPLHSMHLISPRRPRANWTSESPKWQHSKKVLYGNPPQKVPCGNIPRKSFIWQTTQNWKSLVGSILNQEPSLKFLPCVPGLTQCHNHLSLSIYTFQSNNHF
jgi:hypothetical protein